MKKPKEYIIDKKEEYKVEDILVKYNAQKEVVV